MFAGALASSPPSTDDSDGHAHKLWSHDGRRRTKTHSLILSSLAESASRPRPEGARTAASAPAGRLAAILLVVGEPDRDGLSRRCMAGGRQGGMVQCGSIAPPPLVRPTVDASRVGARPSRMRASMSVEVFVVTLWHMTIDETKLPARKSRAGRGEAGIEYGTD